MLLRGLRAERPTTCPDATARRVARVAMRLSSNSSPASSSSSESAASGEAAPAVAAGASTPAIAACVLAPASARLAEADAAGPSTPEPAASGAGVCPREGPASSSDVDSATADTPSASPRWSIRLRWVENCTSRRSASLTSCGKDRATLPGQLRQLRPRAVCSAMHVASLTWSIMRL